MIHHVNNENRRRPASVNDYTKAMAQYEINDKELNRRLRIDGIVPVSDGLLVNSDHEDGAELVDPLAHMANENQKMGLYDDGDNPMVKEKGLKH